MYAGSAYAAGYYAEGAPPIGERRYGTGSITDISTSPGSTITDGGTTAGGSIRDGASTSGGSSITDRTSP